MDYAATAGRVMGKAVARDGRHAMIEQFMADEIPFMFGNPGTTEQGFLDALTEYEKPKYIFALQESIAVAAADGYARASQKLGVIQLHSGVGLGNGIGNLYQAFRGHSPLLIIAGDAGVKYDAMDAQMAADLVAIARPVTKYATRVTHRQSLLRMIRRGVKIALTPPAGPVFVNVPMDVLDEPNDEEVRPSCMLVTRTRPTDEDLQRIALMLRSAAQPMIIMGDGVAYSGASEELEQVARLIGAEVWGANNSEVNINPECSLYCGSLGHMFGFESARHTCNSDVMLICGTYIFPEVFPELVEAKVFRHDAKIIHFDPDAYEIGKNFRVDIGIVSDPKETLKNLAAVLEKTMTSEETRTASQRGAMIAADARSRKAAAQQSDIVAASQVPPPLATFAAQLNERLQRGAMIFDESLTHSEELTRHVVRAVPGTYFQSRGGSLGVGIPGAIGMKLARPDREVFAFIGDGASLYTIQALWTAAHHHVAAKFVICNNHSYRLLKWNLREYWKERKITEHQYPESFDIGHPDPDFVALARSLGVDGERVERPDQIAGAIDRALAADGPYLIDLEVAH